MNQQQIRARRLARERERRARVRRARLIALAALLGVGLVATAIAIAATSGAAVRARSHRRPGQPRRGTTGPARPPPHRPTLRQNERPPLDHYWRRYGQARDGDRARAHVSRDQSTAGGCPVPGAVRPGRRVRRADAGAEDRRLACRDARPARGLLDARRSARARKPIVLTFDNGYASQYENALPILKRLGWVGNENIQLTGLPPSQGGLTDAQVRGLIAAGWELDTQGISHADLITLDAAQLEYQVATARQTLQKRYDVPVNWFCYPSGHYDATVIAAVKGAGFVGSTTVIPGWASPGEDPYRLPRLRVLGGTSPSALLEQIAGAEADGTPPASYGGVGTA